MNRGKLTRRMKIFFFVVIFTVDVALSSFPENEYSYSLRRDKLMEAERKFEKRMTSDSPSETTVDHYLQYLKWKEFARSAVQVTGFSPSRPIGESLKDITHTEVYKALEKMPKGGNMHSHENHDVSRKTLIDIVWNSTDFQYLYILPRDHPHTPWILDFFVNPPPTEPSWIKVKDDARYTKEEILRHQTLLDALSSPTPSSPSSSSSAFSASSLRYDTDSRLRWKTMNDLWDRSSLLISNIKIKKRYILAMYERGLEQGVTYFETRKNLYEEIYELDPSPEYASTFGRRYLDKHGDEEIEMVKRLTQSFADLHPQFIGHRRISTVRRTSDSGKFLFHLENVVRLRDKYPDHVIGFDVIGEEDAGYALAQYLPQLLKLKVPLYLHTAETNWPDDLMASSLVEDNPRVSQFDLFPTLMNIYEAILLNAARIGHGYGFIKHPYLLHVLKKRQVAMEICIVSNQLLGYTPDIRNHPAQHYYRYGIPIILGSDDAGTFGYDNFTVDWYSAFMAWGLDLQDLKVIALNSLRYSALSQMEKQAAIEGKWRPMWDDYIAEKLREACERDFAEEARSENRTASFVRLLPAEGTTSGTTNVHVLGRNFEMAICKNVGCRFGDERSPSAAYLSNYHIICEAPDLQRETTVEVFVSLNGVDFLPTGLLFSYRSNPMSLTMPLDYSNTANGVTVIERHLIHSLLLLLPLIIGLLVY